MSTSAKRLQNLSSNKRVVQISQDALTNLPTSKDLPRLVKIFSLYDSFVVIPEVSIEDSQVYIQNNCCDTPPSKTFTCDEDDDSDDTKCRLMFDLLSSIHERLPNNSTVFPSFVQFATEVDLSDHNTLNVFLLEHFGENHLLTCLTKVLHQTMVIHVLVLLRQLLKSDYVEFKDVQGSWRIGMFFPVETTDQSLSEYNDKICICHRRREQVFDKALNDLGKAYFRSLFQFEWEICVVFDQNGQVFNAFVRLLNCIDNESINSIEDDAVKMSVERKKLAVQRAFSEYNTMDYDTVMRQMKQPPTIAVQKLQTLQVKPPQPDNRRASVSIRSFANLFRRALAVDEKPENDVTRTYTPRVEETSGRTNRGFTLLSRLKRNSRSLSEISAVDLSERSYSL
jgi:hypothetical protein